MDECANSQQFLLPESYIVQPVENVPVSIIDYEKIEMAQIIHTGGLTNGTPVIQLADLNSNFRAKVLHPLEMEIQRDIELKQQEVMGRCQSSVVSSASETEHNHFSNKLQKDLGISSPVTSSPMHIETSTSKKKNSLTETASKLLDDSAGQIGHSTKQVMFGKKQFILVPDNSLILSVGSKEDRNQVNDFTQGNETLQKSVQCLPKLIANNNSSDTFEWRKKTESDSENEEDDMIPVYDYEPDPEGSLTVNKVDHIEKPNECYMCFKSFRQKKNMYAHIRKIHSTQPKIEGGILCPLCKMHALRQEHLRAHLEKLHEIPVEKEEKLFNTMEEFFLWKEQTEKETLSFYVSKSSSKLLANNQQKTYYKCHRSGHYVTLKKENRKKKLKVQGSNKIGATCPAAIEVTENIHGINVTFWKTHVGHDNDLAHLVLSKEDKGKILEYLACGLSWDKILETFRKENTRGSSLPSKLTAASKQDLRNIKKVHDTKGSSEPLMSRGKIIQGRKPVKERMLRRASQSLVIEKAELLLNLLESADVKPEFRPKICLMIDNLISTVKRRAVKNSKRENISHKRRQWMRKSHSFVTGERDQRT